MLVLNTKKPLVDFDGNPMDETVGNVVAKALFYHPQSPNAYRSFELCNEFKDKSEVELTETDWKLVEDALNKFGTFSAFISQIRNATA